MMLRKDKNSLERGFTLIEVLIFVAIFSGLIVTFMAVFVSVSQIQVRQGSLAEVASQTQFLLQNIQHQVERSSLIEMQKDVTTSTLKLRMASSTEDPTIFQFTGSAVTMKQGSGPTRVLTSNKVRVNSISFTKRENSPGHDSVAIAIAMEYNTANIKQSFAHNFRTGISRVTAATFDSNVVPSSGDTFVLGVSPEDWKSINGTVFFANSNVGIGIGAPAHKFQVNGGDIYIGTAGQGLLIKAPNGTTCLRITASNTGTLLTASSTCPS